LILKSTALAKRDYSFTVAVVFGSIFTGSARLGWPFKRTV
jgi:hypothetical protein